MIINPASFVTWDTLAPWVTMHLKEVPSFLVDDQLRVAVRRFFSRSCVWRTDLVTLATTVALQRDYSFTPPTNAELNRLHKAWIGNQPLDALDGQDINDDEPGSTSLTPGAGVRDRNTIVLLPVPLTGGSVVTGRVSLRPSSSAPGIPGEAFDEWKSHIGAGAAAELMLMADRPWSASPALARDLEERFNNGVRAAAARAGTTRAKPLRVTPA